MHAGRFRTNLGWPEIMASPSPVNDIVDDSSFGLPGVPQPATLPAKPRLPSPTGRCCGLWHQTDADAVEQIGQTGGDIFIVILVFTLYPSHYFHTNETLILLYRFGRRWRSRNCAADWKQLQPTVIAQEPMHFIREYQLLKLDALSPERFG